jgi:hypothetical protein
MQVQTEEPAAAAFEEAQAAAAKPAARGKAEIAAEKPRATKPRKRVAKVNASRK